MKYTVALTALVACSIMLFQNCGKVNFSDANAASGNLKLTTIDTPDSGSSGNGSPSQTLPISHKEDDDHDDDDHEEAYGKCTVGPGQSKKLALVSDDDLEFETSVGEDLAVCVTRKGCLEIAAEKFGETAFKEDIGFCKNGHHQHLDDDELQELVDQE